MPSLSFQLLRRLEGQAAPHNSFVSIQLADSNPISSTILQKGTWSVHRGSNRFVPGRRRFGLSGCYGESLCANSTNCLELCQD